MKRFLIGLVILLIGLYFAACWYFSNLILHPPQGDPIKRAEVMSTMVGTGAESVYPGLAVPDTFSVLGAGNKKISGWHFKATNTQCGIILAHGWSGYRVDMNKYMPLFESCGCDFVTYDHRGHHQSEEAFATGGLLEAEDLLRITDWLQQQTGLPDQQIGWLGVSWGGATVLQAGGSDENVAFIVSDSPFQNWYSAVLERAIRDYGSWINAFVPGIKTLVKWRAGVDFDAASALDQAANIEEPVLLIHSKADSSTASTQSVNIAAALNTQNSTFYHTDFGNDHAKDISNNPLEFKTYVQDFMAKYTPGFGACSVPQDSTLRQ